MDYVKSFIDKFSKTNLTIEFLTHPGYIDDYTKSITSYLNRDKELQILKTAKELGLFDDVELINYSEL